MAIVLNFSKSDSNAQWGFRLVGGADFETPLVVIKVYENSLAQQIGLEEGDIVVRINDTPTAGLTHAKAHELLSRVGNEFELGVRRGDILYYQQWVNDIENNVEVSEILKNMVQSDDQYKSQLQSIIIEEENISTDKQEISTSKSLQKSERSVEATTECLQKSSEMTECQSVENLKGQEIIVDPNKLNQKWSTFLKKPDNPLPLPRKTEEQRKIEGEPYRVVIKKQKRKNRFGKKVEFDEKDVVISTTDENLGSEISNEETEDIEITSDVTSEIHSEIEVELKVTEIEEIEVCEEEASDNENSRMEIQEIEEKVTQIQTDIESEASLTLEQQLIQVQRQLQALSQLPSAIQTTLDAVSQQLAQIVGVRKASEEKEEDEIKSVEENDDINDEDFSLPDRTEADITEKDDNDDIQSQLEEDLNIHYIEEEDEQEIPTEDLEPNESPEDKLTEEEQESIRIEKEKVDKKNKKMEMRPIQRPIILPGGRKWTEPDDACPSVRTPKMSDEKIANTIEIYSEVIVGKTKGLTIGTRYGHGPTSTSPSTVGEFYVAWTLGFGFCRESNCYLVPSRAIASNRINFLKYQPPPKNLDYLQRSEVYRLVHDMEPPVRGISTRVEKILSEQDYVPHGAP